MTNATKLIAGLLLIAGVTAIEYGGTFSSRYPFGQVCRAHRISALDVSGRSRARRRAHDSRARCAGIHRPGRLVRANRMGGSDRIPRGSCSGERRVFRRGDRQRQTSLADSSRGCGSACLCWADV